MYSSGTFKFLFYVTDMVNLYLSHLDTIFCPFITTFLRFGQLELRMSEQKFPRCATDPPLDLRSKF